MDKGEKRGKEVPGPHGSLALKAYARIASGNILLLVCSTMQHHCE